MPEILEIAIPISAFIMGVFVTIFFIVFLMLPPGVRPILFGKKKTIFLLQDGTRKLQFIIPKTEDSVKFETKKLLFDTANRPASSLGGRRCYLAYTGYGGVLDTGIVKVMEEFNNTLDGRKLDPKAVMSIHDPMIPDDIKAKKGFMPFRILHQSNNGDDAYETENYAVAARMPSHGIADLAAVRHFMLTNMPAITLKQYAIAQSALQRLTQMMGEGKNWFKYFLAGLLVIFLCYFLKILFTGETATLPNIRGMIPGAGGVGP